MRRKLFAGMMVFLAAVVPVVGSVKVGATEQPVAAGVVVGEMIWEIKKRQMEKLLRWTAMVQTPQIQKRTDRMRQFR